MRPSVCLVKSPSQTSLESQRRPRRKTRLSTRARLQTSGAFPLVHFNLYDVFKVCGGFTSHKHSCASTTTENEAGRPFVTFYLLMWFGKENIAKKNLTFSDFPASDRVQQHLTFVDFSDKTDKYSSYVSRSITIIRFASEKARL